MEFTVNTNEITKAVNTLSHIATIRGSRKEYSYIAICADDSGLRLEATDGIVFMTANLDASVNENGQCALDGKMLSDVIKKQPCESISFSMADGRATIRSGKAKAQLAVKPLDDFPDEPRLLDSEDPRLTFLLPVSGVMKCVSNVGYAVSTDPLRPILCGILLELQGNHIRTVAIDGFRMAIQDHEYDQTATDTKKIIIPKASAMELISLLSDEKNETVRLNTDGKRLIVNSSGFVFNTSLTVGEFLDYERISKSDIKTRVKVSCKLLKEAVERSMIVARSADKYLVTLSFDNEWLDVTSKAAEGETSERLDASMQGEPIKISFNGSYLLDALKHAGDGDIEIGLGTSVSPATIQNIEDKSLFNMILPVRTLN